MPCPLPNTVLNASLSRRLVTRSRSFKTALPCPFQHSLYGRLHHYKGSSVSCPCSCCTGACRKMTCPSLPLYNTFLNASCSRRLFTHSRSFQINCHALSDSPVACPTGPRGQLSLLSLDGAEKCPAFPFILPNTVLNARCSRRIFTYFR